AFLAGLAKARGDLGMLYSLADRTAEARPVLLAAREAARELAATHPGETGTWETLHEVQFHLARFFRQVGELSAAAAAQRESLAAIDRLARDRPADLRLRYVRAAGLMDLGELDRDLSRSEEAAAAFREGQGLLDQLVRENPTVSLYRRAL